MIQPVEYCVKCGRQTSYITVSLKESKDVTISEVVPVCRKCLLPIEIDLIVRTWNADVEGM